MKFIAFILTLLCGFSALARPISVSGRIMTSSNVAIESPYVQLKLVFSNSLSCTLYEEIHNVDMTASNGYFKIVAGSGTVIFGANGFNIFNSNKNYLCRDGSTWAAGLNDIRKYSVSVKVESDAWVDFSSDVVTSIAYANEAESLQGRGQADFVQTNSNVTQAKVASLTSNVNALVDLATGVSSLYATTTQMQAELALKEPKKPDGTNYLTSANNLSDIANPASARQSLQLGAIALKNTIDNNDVSSIAWNKISGAPSAFPPTGHSHNISDIINLATTLSDKADKSIFTCSASQVVQFVSATGLFSCVNIGTGGDLSGSLSSAILSKIQGRNLVISNPQDQDVLAYNVSTSRWENRPNNLSTATINTIGDITAGNIVATKQISGSTNAGISANSAILDFANGNTVILSHNCSGNIDLSNLKNGGTYTFVNLDTAGTTKCTFTASSISGAVIKYSPANTNRSGGGNVTVYSFIRAENYILVAWSSSFQ